MKKVILILGMICFGCSRIGIGSNKLHSENVKIYEIEEYHEYSFFYGREDNDTILFIAKKNHDYNLDMVELFIDRRKAKQIEKLTSSNETLWFYYSIWDSNRNFKVTMGTFSPESDSVKCFNSYSSYPYLINSNAAFVEKMR